MIKRVQTPLLFAIIIFSLSLSCSKGTEEKAFVTFHVGDATIQRAAEDARQVKIKDIVRNGDIIKTGESTRVVIQVSDSIVIRIGEKTKVIVEKLTSSTRRKITLEEGIIMTRVMKIEKGNPFRVQTPVCVVAVRGTQFLTEYNTKNMSGVVSVGEGKVSFSKIKSGTENSDTAFSEEVMVEAGKAAVVKKTTGKIVIRDAVKEEKIKLDIINMTPVIENIEEAEPEGIRSKFNDVKNIIEKKERELENLLKNKALTLSDIRARYGKIQEVHLYNGKVYKGAIILRGNTFKILTVKGVVLVPKKNIKTTKTL